MDANWLITGANIMGQRTAQEAAYNLAHEGRASYVESFYKEAQKAAVEYFSLSVGQRKLVRDQIRYSTLNSKNFMIFKSLTGFRKDHDRAKHQELTPYPQLGFSRRKYPAQRVGKGSAGMSQIVSTSTEIEAMVISSVCQGVSHLLIRQRPAARNNVGVTLPAL